MPRLRRWIFAGVARLLVVEYVGNVKSKRDPSSQKALLWMTAKNGLAPGPEFGEEADRLKPGPFAKRRKECGTRESN
jgi:hypothetical protein